MSQIVFAMGFAAVWVTGQATLMTVRSHQGWGRPSRTIHYLYLVSGGVLGGSTTAGILPWQVSVVIAVGLAVGYLLAPNDDDDDDHRGLRQHAAGALKRARGYLAHGVPATRPQPV